MTADGLSPEPTLDGGGEPGVQRFRKKPVVVEAIQWTGGNGPAVLAFAGGHFATVDPEDRGDDAERTAEVFDVLHGTWVGLRDGQWVIRGVKGELYPCDAEVLAETYEPVADAEVRRG